MNVPGHDGRKGFVRACFLKDSLSFDKICKKFRFDLNSLKQTIKINNKIRSVI